MGIDASNNIKLKQQEKDSPFLTLSERNQKGISSQNIFGGDEKAGQTQEPKRTERIAQLNIFGAEEGGQVKDDTSVFGEQEQKGCDEYFQEDTKGEMNFDTNGFYGDAIGVSFGSSAASNPIKAGASDTKGLETELKLMLRNPEQNKTQIENLKEQIKAQGGDADKIIADNTPKTGATKGANATTKAGTTENAAKTATAGTTATASKTATGNAANALGSGGSVSDLMAYADQAGIGTQVDIVAGRGSSSSSALSGSSSDSSSSAGIGDAIKNAFSPTNIASKAAEGVTGSVVSGVMNPVQETISGYMKDGLKAIGIGKGSDKGGELDAGKAKNAKTIEEANKNVENADKNGKKADTDNKNAKFEAKNAQAQETSAKQAEAKAKVDAGKFEATEAQQTEQAQWQEHEAKIQKATAEEKCAIKEAKKAEGEQLNADISSLKTNISSLESQASAISEPDETGEKLSLQNEIAMAKAELAEKQAQLAKCKQEESLATTDEQEAQRLSQEAQDLAAEAEESAASANEAAEEAKRLCSSSRASALKYDAVKNEQINIAKATEQTIQKAGVFKEASQARIAELGRKSYGRE